MDTYLTLRLGDETFAVSVDKVLEVLQRQRVTSVPKTPAHIIGIINFRGDILPVIDSRQKFGLSRTNINQKHVVIVFELMRDSVKTLIAATADGVRDVITIDANEIKPVPELGLSYDIRFIQGAVHRNDSFILLLDIEKVFSTADFAAFHQNHQPEAETVLA